MFCILSNDNEVVNLRVMLDYIYVYFYAIYCSLTNAYQKIFDEMRARLIYYQHTIYPLLLSFE